MHIYSEGVLTLQEIYSMPFKMRHLYIKLTEEYNEKKKSLMKAS